MEKSSGIIAYRKRKGSDEMEFLLCSPAGPYWIHRKLFSFPKGHVEKTDENDKIAAIREFKEETSFDLSGEMDNIVDFDTIRQNKSKMVHVFLYHDKDYKINASELKCLFKTEIEFPKNSNKFILIDEVDSYCWLTYKEITDLEHIKIYDSIYRSLSES